MAYFNPDCNMAWFAGDVHTTIRYCVLELYKREQIEKN